MRMGIQMLRRLASTGEVFVRHSRNGMMYSGFLSEEESCRRVLLIERCRRSKSHWKFNMHWTSPADEAAHDDYLQVLSARGFDKVLQEVGTYFELNAISAYHLLFIGVSHCKRDSSMPMSMTRVERLSI